MRVENVKGAWTVDDLEYCRKRPLKVSRTASASSSSSSTSSLSQPAKQPKLDCTSASAKKEPLSGTDLTYKLNYLQYQQQRQTHASHPSRSNHISKYYEFLNSKKSLDTFNLMSNPADVQGNLKQQQVTQLNPQTALNVFHLTPNMNNTNQASFTFNNHLINHVPFTNASMSSATKPISYFDQQPAPCFGSSYLSSKMEPSPNRKDQTNNAESDDSNASYSSYNIYSSLSPVSSISSINSQPESPVKKSTWPPNRIYSTPHILLNLVNLIKMITPLIV